MAWKSEIIMVKMGIFFWNVLKIGFLRVLHIKVK